MKEQTGTRMTFGNALESLKEGKRVARTLE